MGINLQKGQTISLEKEAPGLSRVLMGLGWDTNNTSSQKSGGFFSKLFSAPAPAFDLDAACIMLDQNNKLVEMVYFGNLKSKNGSVIHTGDNLTGEGAGDDEQIIVELVNLPSNVYKLVFCVSIFQAQQRKQDFGQVQNAFVRMVNSANNNEVARYNLSSGYTGMTSMIMAEVYKENNEWKMSAIGEGSQSPSLSDMSSRYR